MSEKLTVGELVYKISGDMDNLKAEVKRSDTELKKLQKTMEKNKKSTQGFSSAFKAAKVALTGFVTGALIRGIYQMAQSGAELQTLGNSFNQLTSNLNLNSDEVLNSLKRLSGGTIANKDLIAAANRAMVLGVATDMDEFSTLMQTARLRARDMGITTTQAFDNIVTGIGRGSPLILDNLGFIVSATEAQEEYAKQLGITADKLTEAQKKQALKNTILKQGNEEIERAGDVTANYSDRLAQASTFVTNLKDNIGRAMLPALASLIDANLKNSKSLDLTNEQVNALGKRFYQFGQGLIVVTKIVKNFFGVMKLVASAFVVSVTTVLKSLLQLGDDIGKVFGVDTSVLKQGIKNMEEFNNNLLDNAIDTKDAMLDNNEELIDSLKETLDPKSYQGVSDGQLQAILDDTADSVDGVGGAAEGAEEKVEDFTDKLLALRDEAVKTREELENKLEETFETFGENLKDNIEESVNSLAQVVLAAEQSKKEIKEALKDSDLTSDSRKELKAQLKEQEAILKSRKDFEERQAENILAIRKRLEDAGIDAAKAGLDGLLNVRSLEEALEEERRVASLDEFQRLEQEQTRKLTALVNAFVTEANLQQEKILKQKEYEEEITIFLVNEDAKRLANTQVWATATLAEYGKLASSLKSLISQQERLNALRAGSSSGSSRSTPSSTSYSRSSTVNNTKNVTAPITINGANQSRVEDLGKEIAWELGRN